MGGRGQGPGVRGQERRTRIKERRITMMVDIRLRVPDPWPLTPVPYFGTAIPPAAHQGSVLPPSINSSAPVM
jgi:hypothetical protein